MRPPAASTAGDRRWLVHLAGYALVAGALYFGLRSRAPTEPAGASSSTPTSATAQAAPPSGATGAPVADARGQPAVEPRPRNVPSALEPPGAPATREHATSRAQAALDAQRGAIAKACLVGGAPMVLTLRVLFDPSGKETQRSARQDEGAANPALIECVVGDPHKLDVGPLGEPTSALLKLRLP